MPKRTFLICFIILLTSLISCRNQDSKQAETPSDMAKIDSVVEEQNLPIPQERMEDKDTQDSLIRAMMNRVEEIDYALKAYTEKEASENFLNARIQTLNTYRKMSNKPLIKVIDQSKIDQVFFGRIKGKEEMGKNLFPRAEIEIWACGSQSEAEALSQEIERVKKEAGWDEISKSPITYWQQDNWIVFITPGGFYMLDKVGEIEDYLRRELKKLA